ncbi:MAG: hypothetical protein Barrevirus1_7 [Barrevirus sp.]|uniref:Uncharacterized protein n=1 Tax=Barrevirus sp. TaxID=2487763 RepID=A0A3G4ZPH4_9VIRU|nr:MAG: hypothetical protein Barrevirus1_7 [Barrevirus sp.]
MNQTLAHWFGSEADEEEKCKLKNQKNIFYFDSNTMEAKWLNKQPKNITFSLVVKWNNVSINVCTNLEQDHNYKIPSDTTFNLKSISYIKSNLQKCIRRKLNDQAIKTAYHFIKLSINEFLRRISIIIIEDVILHYSYSTIVWLMAATSSKKSTFKPNKYIIDFLLGFTNTLCNINEYDKIGINDLDYDLEMLGNYDLLYSLQFRKSYGGMDSDVDMLNYITGIWLDRFKSNIDCNKTEIKLINSTNIGELTLDDWKLEGDNCAGVDFHCAPYIIDILAKKYNKYSENEIQSAIWNCSSKINYRKNNKKSAKDIEIWNMVELQLYRVQQDLLSKIYQ